MKKIDRILKIIFAVLFSAALVFGIWATVSAAPPMPPALDALASDNQVRVDSEPWLIFRPQGKQPTVGLIIYPGALVDARAYAPVARAIAQRGYVVIITPMLFNLAFFGEDRARQVTPFFPGIRQWALAGHSLGGVVAASHVRKNESPRGLIFWASYPGEGDDLSRKPGIIVASIYATNDKLATPEKALAGKSRLPIDTRFVGIEGGNHAQFGWYGTQSGDGEATISREQQQEQIVTATIGVLQQLERLP
jgi:dienelactone hydrolase